MIWNGQTITPGNCIRHEGHFVSLGGEICQVQITPFGMMPPGPGWAALPSPESARLAINLLKYINSVRPEHRPLPVNEVVAAIVRSPEDDQWYKMLVRLTEEDEWEVEGKPIPAALWGTEQDAGGALDTWRFAD